MLKGICEQLHLPARAVTANFWQARPPQWQPHQWHNAAAAFYYAKFRQDLDIGGLSSRGGPTRILSHLEMEILTSLSKWNYTILKIFYVQTFQTLKPNP